MNEETIKRMRSEAEEIFLEAVKAVDPYTAVKNFVHPDGERVTVGRPGGDSREFNLSDFERISIVGGGKATAPMARAIEELFEGRIDAGTVNVKYGFRDELSITEQIEAGHPVPDQNGVEGTKRIMKRLEHANEKDLIFSLISGGGSALLPLPAGQISLPEKQNLTGELLACGASIDEINAVRKHISSSKGGHMARAAWPATTVNLMLSDVVGDKVDVIASGPFVPDSSTFDDVKRILAEYDLSVPESIRSHIQAGLQGNISETPKEDERAFSNVYNTIIGSNILALEAAGTKAEQLGYRPLILSSMIEGESRDVARIHMAIAGEILKTGRPLEPPVCVITGGETTVTLRGSGLGGRNQEFCLAAVGALSSLPPRVVLLSAGTDGNDGPTEAAGAAVDPLTLSRGKKAGLHSEDFLKNNDSYHYLEKTGNLIFTGPTRTNVMDVRLILIR